MAKPNGVYEFLRGDYGDTVLDVDLFQRVNYVDDLDHLIIKDIVDAIEIIEKQQQKYVDRNERALKDISIKGQVLNSLMNARDLMSVFQERSVSRGPRSFPPTPDDMRDFLKKWRKKRSSS